MEDEQREAMAAIHPDMAPANSEDIDSEFYERCLRIAGDDRTLRREAQFFHALCDVWGRYRWPAAAKE